MMIKQGQQRGYTLAQYSIVLAIVAVLSYHIVNDQATELAILDYESVQFSADVVGSAAQAYYTFHCDEGAGMSSPSVSSLIDDEFILNAGAAENRMDLPFTVLIVGAGTDNPDIQVRTTAASAPIAQQLADADPSAEAIGTTVVYHFKPPVSRSPTEVRLQQMQEYFGDSYCK
ncbi:hypothetical protein [Alteromonas antoniana]|uniref:hypothetical protein n=1 Tax=Alteromonas antoniana TaxID=2803813 RepID=UPI001C45EA67|nr:hypothetical protein [Alteromonas antoniana]